MSLVRFKDFCIFTPICFTRLRKVCFKVWVNVVLPLLKGPNEICEKLQISIRSLHRWEINEVIPFHGLGKTHRYLEEEVEVALQARRFGPPLPDLVSKSKLRQRVSAKWVCIWLKISRDTLEDRMRNGLVPYYKIGQTYRFAPDELESCLGINLAPEGRDASVLKGARP